MTAYNFAVLQVEQVRLAVVIVEPGEARAGRGDQILREVSMRIPGYPVMLVSATGPRWQGIETYATFRLPAFHTALLLSKSLLWQPLPDIEEPELPF